MEFNSIDLGELSEALAKAQAEMANPKFDKTNPHFRNKFASLAAVRDAVLPILSKHGIACVQDLTNVTGGVACTTLLLHSSGQRVSFGPLEMPVSKNDAQGFGSAATYARRYHLMAVANVVGDEDDDANQATGKPAAATPIANDIGVHSPLGDVEVNDEVRAYADSFRTAVDPIVIRQLAADLKEEGEETYRAVWSLLDSKTRSGIKKVLDTKAAA
jgi:ERF superfamily